MKNLHQLKYKSLVHAVAASLLVAGSVLQADDISVYVTTSVSVGPNILFILDESGSMNWKGNGRRSSCFKREGGYCNDPQQRMYQLRKALLTLLDDDNMDNVKVAILGFSGTRGYTKVHTDFVRVKDHRDYLQDDVIGDWGLDTDFGELGKKKKGQLITSGGTPSVPALKEGMAWFRGKKSGYKSPIDKWCEPNHIVFLSDGEPNRNEGDTTYEGVNCKDNEPDIEAINWADTSGSSVGARCAATIAKWGYEHRPLTGETWSYGDNDPDKKLFRNVITHTIGFHVNSGRRSARKAKKAFLKGIADRSLDENPAHAGYDYDNNYGEDLPGYDPDDPDDRYTGGRFMTADNATQLLNALKTVVDQANQGINYSYSAPTIPFNADNAAVSGSEMYLPIFEPSANNFWKGNIKKYEVKYDKASGKLKILDKDNKSVIDASFNFVSAVDYWNLPGDADGAQPLVGGANSNMAPPRYLYTYLDGNSTDLTDADNRVHPDNTKITKELMDVGDDVSRNEQLNWANWFEKDGVTPREGENAPQMGAPLHTTPLTVRYKSGEELVFLNTTEGILHAFDAETGKEVWAYMPDELLKTIKHAKKNEASELPMYGLDGPMTIYRIDTIYQDDDNDGFPDKDEDGEEIIKVPGKIYLIVGMRRGFSKGSADKHVNRNYYTLDITDPETPQFAWEIKGGVTPGFDKLGQTWSKPIFTRLELEGGDVQDVLIFGGGYDGDQDEIDVQTDDDLGNVIYIVNPKTGGLIREIDSDDMAKGKMGNAIPSDVLPVDINANGVTDRLYAVDVGGRVIRVDIPDKALAAITGSSDLKGSVLANVGGTGNGDGKLQRFFNTPEVAYYKRGTLQFLTLLVGSGNRTDLVDKSVTDRFYAIKDQDVWMAPSEYPDVLTEDDLYDSTLNIVQDSSDADERAEALIDIASAGGWFIDLDTGEKVLSEAKVYDFAVLFTVYKAEKTEPDVCTASSVEGESSLYILDMRHGGSRFNVESGEFEPGNTTDLHKDDRKISLKIPGMPPSPTLMFPADDGGAGPSGWVLAMVGLQVPAKWPDKYHPISWEEVIED